jgi:hypothetical protein
MGDRFTSSEHDLGGRLQHWQDGLGLLNTPADWAIGKGLGRFPQSYYFNVWDREIPGGYRIGDRSGNRYLLLFGPRHESGYGELLRVAQRMPVVPGGQYTVALNIRASEKAQLHVEICEKHLLYFEVCANAAVLVDAAGDVVQRKVASLDGKRLTGGPWYAPRLAFFALALESPGQHIEIDDVSLLGPDGKEVLANGDFGRNMERWFFTSDRSHLPWHIKNIGLDTLFDQGLVGLVSLALLVGTALLRLTVGRARRHPFAPFLAASLVGFLVVGAFDSLLDVPRLAFLFYLLVLLGLSIPVTSGSLGEQSKIARPRNAARN